MRLNTRDLALLSIFAALYSVLSLVSLSPVIGDVGASIKLSSILAPLVGIILGPYLGMTAASLGGFIGWSIAQTGTFGFLSFVPGAFTAAVAGFLNGGKRVISVILYATVFLCQAFYPTIGPVWLFPYFLWFQLVGLVVLLLPLTSATVKPKGNKTDLRGLSLAIVTISLVSTLAGQIAGNLLFEITRWPIIYPQVEYWRIMMWEFLTVVYPVERVIITLLALIVGIPLIKAISAYGFEIGGIKKNATRSNQDKTSKAEQQPS